MSTQIAPLSLPTTPMPDESLQGLIARAARRNVLGRTSSLLRPLGITHAWRTGLRRELADGDLAKIIGCDPADIAARRTPLFASDSRVIWGGGELYRIHLELAYRRVSPAAFTSSDHHRAAWMNRLLPYCAETNELLIDTCMACGARQRWAAAWGIGNCDECREPLRHSTRETLNPAITDGYRRFSRLVSIEAGVRQRALAELHPDLRDLPPASLVDLIVKLGGLQLSERFSHQNIRCAPAALIARIVAHGTQVAYRWRHAVKEVLDRRVREIPVEDIAKYARLQSDVHQLARLAPAVRRAVPHAFTGQRQGLRIPEGMVGRQAAIKLTGLNSRQLDALEDAQAIEKVEGGRRCFYDPRSVASLNAAWRGSCHTYWLEKRLGVPRYAIEQLICLGALRWENHPGVRVLDSHVRMTSASAQAFLEDITGNGGGLAPPNDAISLHEAMFRYGGGPKPWGPVLSAMRLGRFSFWLKGGALPFAKRAHINPKDLKSSLAPLFDETYYPHFPFSAAITQSDALDLLNLDPRNFSRAQTTGHVQSLGRAGRALLAPRDEVLAAAKTFISPKELLARLQPSRGGSPGLFWLKRNLPPRSPFGWNRADCETQFGLL